MISGCSITNYALDLDAFSASPSMPSYQRASTVARRARRFAEQRYVNANHIVTSYTTAANREYRQRDRPNYSGSKQILGVQRRDFQYNQQSRYYLGGFDWDFDRVR